MSLSRHPSRNQPEISQLPSLTKKAGVCNSLNVLASAIHSIAFTLKQGSIGLIQLRLL